MCVNYAIYLSVILIGFVHSTFIIAYSFTYAAPNITIQILQYAGCQTKPRIAN